jgi:hypothetical protein
MASRSRRQSTTYHCSSASHMQDPRSRRTHDHSMCIFLIGKLPIFPLHLMSHYYCIRTSTIHAACAAELYHNKHVLPRSESRKEAEKGKRRSVPCDETEHIRSSPQQPFPPALLQQKRRSLSQIVSSTHTHTHTHTPTPSITAEQLQLQQAANSEEKPWTN